MARIRTYPDDDVLTGGDKLLGTDAMGNAQANYTLREIKAFVLDETVKPPPFGYTFVGNNTGGVRPANIHQSFAPITTNVGFYNSATLPDDAEDVFETEFGGFYIFRLSTEQWVFETKDYIGAYDVLTLANKTFSAVAGSGQQAITGEIGDLIQIDDEDWYLDSQDRVTYRFEVTPTGDVDATWGNIGEAIPNLDEVVILHDSDAPLEIATITIPGFNIGSFNLPQGTLTGASVSDDILTLTRQGEDDIVFEGGGDNTTYSLNIPSGTTDLQLSGSDDSEVDITFMEGNGINITRMSATTFRISATGDASDANLTGDVVIGTSGASPVNTLIVHSDTTFNEDVTFADTITVDFGNATITGLNYSDITGAPALPDSLDDLTGTTDDVTEGTTNLYYTDTRVDTRIGLASIGDLVDINDVSTQTDGSAYNLVWDNTNSRYQITTVPDAVDAAVYAGVIDVSNNIEAVSRNLYLFKGETILNLALPPAPTAGDWIDIANYSSSAVHTITASSTEEIENQGTDRVLSLDNLSASFRLVYADDTVGWTIIGGDGFNEGEDNQNAFTTISVSGQSDVVAEEETDTLTLAAGDNITITTDADSDTITIASTDTNTQLTQEQVEDYVGGMLTGPQTNISVTYNDADGSLSFVSTDTNTQLSNEQVQDIVGAMFSSNTETNITATYQDTDGTIDLVVDQRSDESIQDLVGAMFTGNTETGISVTYQDSDGTIDLVVSASGDVYGSVLDVTNDLEAISTNLYLFKGEDVLNLALPANPNVGDWIDIANYSTTAVHTITASSTEEIQNQGADDRVLSLDNHSASFRLVYADSDVGWTIIGGDGFGAEGDAANNDTIMLTAGTGLDGGGSFTLDQDSDETITFNIDSTVVTLAGSQTLTNKSIDASQLTGDIDDDRLSSNVPLLDATLNTFTGDLYAGKDLRATAPNNESPILRLYEGTVQRGNIQYNTSDNRLKINAHTGMQFLTGTSFPLTSRMELTDSAFTVSVATSFTGGVTLGDVAGDTITINGTIASAGIPFSASNTLTDSGVGKLNDIPSLPEGDGTTQTSVLQTTGASGSETYTWVDEGGSGENNQDAFATISVSGQTDITADEESDTVTFAGGTNVTLTTSGSTLTITATDTNTQLSNEQVQDIAGAMFSSNTETGISATYQDSDGTIDLEIQAATASVLGGVTIPSDSEISIGENGALTLKTLSLSTDEITTGVLPVVRGGTGLTSLESLLNSNVDTGDVYNDVIDLANENLGFPEYNLYVFSGNTTQNLPLPSSPSKGDWVDITNLSTIATHTITPASGDRIQSQAEDEVLTLDNPSASFRLVYSGVSSIGWAIVGGDGFGSGIDDLDDFDTDDLAESATNKYLTTSAQDITGVKTFTSNLEIYAATDDGDPTILFYNGDTKTEKARILYNDADSAETLDFRLGTLTKFSLGNTTDHWNAHGSSARTITFNQTGLSAFNSGDTLINFEISATTSDTQASVINFIDIHAESVVGGAVTNTITDFRHHVRMSELPGTGNHILLNNAGDLSRTTISAEGETLDQVGGTVPSKDDVETGYLWLKDNDDEETYTQIALETGNVLLNPGTDDTILYASRVAPRGESTGLDADGNTVTLGVSDRRLFFTTTTDLTDDTDDDDVITASEAGALGVNISVSIGDTVRIYASENGVQGTTYATALIVAARDVSGNSSFAFYVRDIEGSDGANQSETVVGLENITQDRYLQYVVLPNTQEINTRGIWMFNGEDEDPLWTNTTDESPVWFDSDDSTEFTGITRIVEGANVTFTQGTGDDAHKLTISSVGSDGGEANQDAFSTIAVSGQTNITADDPSDTLTIAEGDNVTITTSGSTLTIAAADTNTQLSTEEVQDIIGAMVSDNTETNISVTYDDDTGKLNFASTDTNTQLSQEQVEDFVGGMLTGTQTNITVTYDDTDGELDFVVDQRSDESIEDLVGAMFSSNTETNITATYQDTDGTIDLVVSDETIQDIVGAMFSSNTETGITATYQDSDGTIDLVVSASGDVYGNVLDVSNNLEAISTNLYLFKGGTALNLALPANPSSGDWIDVANYSTIATHTITAASTENIQNQGASDKVLTLDNPSASFRLVYADSTVGWTIVGGDGFGTEADAANDNTITLTAGTGLDGGGTFTLDQDSDEEFTFSIDTTEVVTLTDTQTLTNKSISADQINSGELALAQIPDLTIANLTDITGIGSGEIITDDERTSLGNIPDQIGGTVPDALTDAGYVWIKDNDNSEEYTQSEEVTGDVEDSGPSPDVKLYVSRVTASFPPSGDDNQYYNGVRDLNDDTVNNISADLLSTDRRLAFTTDDNFGLGQQNEAKQGDRNDINITVGTILRVYDSSGGNQGNTYATVEILGWRIKGDGVNGSTGDILFYACRDYVGDDDADDITDSDLTHASQNRQVFILQSQENKQTIDSRGVWIFNGEDNDPLWTNSTREEFDDLDWFDSDDTTEFTGITRIVEGSNITFTQGTGDNADTLTISSVGSDGGEANQDAFSTISVADQTNITADDPSDTLTIAGGDNITITTSGSTLTITGTDTNTQLSTEEVQDIVGAMFSSNTETNITATYQDDDGTIDLVVDQRTDESIQDLVGAMFSSNTETNITATYDDADGTIDLVVATETIQDIVGAMFSSNTETNITATYQDGDGTIDLVVSQRGDESIQDLVGAMFSGNTETNITATYQDGDGTIDLVVDQRTDESIQDVVGAMFSSNTETNITATYQDTDGTIDLVVAAETIQDIVGAMFSSNTETNITATYQDTDGTIDLVVDQRSDESIQDLVGAMFTGNTETGITATYQDTDGTIDLVVTASGSGDVYGAVVDVTDGLDAISTNLYLFKGDTALNLNLPSDPSVGDWIDVANYSTIATHTITASSTENIANQDTDKVLTLDNPSASFRLVYADDTVGWTIVGGDGFGSGSGDITISGTPDYISASGGTLTLEQIDLTADVTGILPVDNFADITTAKITDITGVGSGSIITDDERTSLDNIPDQIGGTVPVVGDVSTGYIWIKEDDANETFTQVAAANGDVRLDPTGTNTLLYASRVAPRGESTGLDADGNTITLEEDDRRLFFTTSTDLTDSNTDDDIITADEAGALGVNINLEIGDLVRVYASVSGVQGTTYATVQIVAARDVSGNSSFAFYVRDITEDDGNTETIVGLDAADATNTQDRYIQSRVLPVEQSIDARGLWIYKGSDNDPLWINATTELPDDLVWLDSGGSPTFEGVTSIIEGSNVTFTQGTGANAHQLTISAVGSDGGEENQDAFSVIEVADNTNIAADDPSDTLIVAAGDNITLSTSGSTLTIAATDTNTQLSDEQVQDIIGAMVTGNTETNISVTYDDDTGKLNFASTDTDTQLSTEEVQDIVGAMFTSNTETNIAATYEDSDGTIDLVVTQRSDESIQDIVGAMFSSNTETNITATYQDGDGTIDLVVATETIQDIVGAMFSSNTETNITATYQDGDGTIDLVVAQRTDESIQDLVGAMFTGNTETGITVSYQDGDGTIDLVVDSLNIDDLGSGLASNPSETTAYNVQVTTGGAVSLVVASSGTALSFFDSDGSTQFAGITEIVEGSNVTFTQGTGDDANQLTISAVGAGGGEANQDAFSTIAVDGQTNVVADQSSDTLTLAAGDNVTITTDADTDTITIAATQLAITGAASTIDTEDLTDGRVLISNDSGKVAVSDISSDELDLLGGRSALVDAAGNGVNGSPSDNQLVAWDDDADRLHWYTIPDATSSVKGVVSVGGGLNVSSGVISVEHPAPEFPTGIDTDTSQNYILTLIDGGGIEILSWITVPASYDNDAITGVVDVSSANASTFGTSAIADGTTAGILSLAAQTIVGAKTFTSNLEIYDPTDDGDPSLVFASGVTKETKANINYDDAGASEALNIQVGGDTKIGISTLLTTLDNRLFLAGLTAPTDSTALASIGILNSTNEMLEYTINGTPGDGQVLAWDTTNFRFNWATAGGAGSGFDQVGGTVPDADDISTGYLWLKVNDTSETFGNAAVASDVEWDDDDDPDTAAVPLIASRIAPAGTDATDVLDGFTISSTTDRRMFFTTETAFNNANDGDNIPSGGDVNEGALLNLSIGDYVRVHNSTLGNANLTEYATARVIAKRTDGASSFAYYLRDVDSSVEDGQTTTIIAIAGSSPYTQNRFIQKVVLGDEQTIDSSGVWRYDADADPTWTNITAEFLDLSGSQTISAGTGDYTLALATGSGDNTVNLLTGSGTNTLNIGTSNSNTTTINIGHANKADRLSLGASVVDDVTFGTSADELDGGTIASFDVYHHTTFRNNVTIGNGSTDTLTINGATTFAAASTIGFTSGASIDFDGATLDFDGATVNNLSAEVGFGSGSGQVATWAEGDDTNDIPKDITGNAATATILETARTIGGVSFNGSQNINLPGVNTSGTQDTTGNAATASQVSTILRTTNATHFFAFVTDNNSDDTVETVYTTDKVTLNPSTGDVATDGNLEYKHDVEEHTSSGSVDTFTTNVFLSTLAITLTLPSDPSTGDWVEFIDRTADTFNCAVKPASGDRIQGQSQNETVVLDIINTGFRLTYVNDAQGWCFLE